MNRIARRGALHPCAYIYGRVTLVLIRGLPGSNLRSRNTTPRGYCHIGSPTCSSSLLMLHTPMTPIPAVRAIALTGDRRAQQWILEQKKIGIVANRNQIAINLACYCNMIVL